LLEAANWEKENAELQKKAKKIQERKTKNNQKLEEAKGELSNADVTGFINPGDTRSIEDILEDFEGQRKDMANEVMVDSDFMSEAVGKADFGGDKTKKAGERLKAQASDKEDASAS
jgi:hypothetical protein